MYAFSPAPSAALRTELLATYFRRSVDVPMEIVHSKLVRERVHNQPSFFRGESAPSSSSTPPSSSSYRGESAHSSSSASSRRRRSSASSKQSSPTRSTPLVMIPRSSGHRHSKFSPKNAVRAAVATAIHTTPFLTHAAQSVPTSSALIQWNDGVAPFESTTALEQLETTGTGYHRRSCPSSDWIPTQASSLASLDPTVVVVDVLTLEDIHSHNHVFSSAYVLGGSGSGSGSGGSGNGGRATVDMTKYLKTMRAYLVDVGDAKYIHHAGGLKAIHLVAPDFSVRHYSVESCITDENAWNANNAFDNFNAKKKKDRNTNTTCSAPSPPSLSSSPPLPPPPQSRAPCPFTSSSTTS